MDQTQPPLPRPPLPPGHQAAMPPQHHHPQMNAPYPPPHPGMHRNSSIPGQPPFVPQMPPQQSPTSVVRRGSFGSMGQSQGPPSQPFHPMQSSPHHPQQPPPAMHPSQMQQRPPPQQQQQQQQQQQPPPQRHIGVSSGSRTPSQGASQRSRQPQFGLNGNWQSDKDMPHRREMIQHIMKMLKKDKNGSPEWLSKLPQMAKQLEVSLYRNARSFDAYTDMTSLKHRLQLIAVEVSQKAKSQTNPSSSSQQSFSNGMRAPSRSSSSSQPYADQDRRGSSQRQMVKMDEINPMAGSASGEQGRQAGGPTSYVRGESSSRRSPAAAGAGGRSASAPIAENSMLAGRNDPDWKARIRHKQQRLLLLHHAAKCPHKDGKCPTTPYCSDMKLLWKHMEGCKDNNCRVSHCFSSRSILSHYRKCKDAHCPACGPVRDTVRKSNPKRFSISSSSTTGRARNGESSSLMGAPSFSSSGALQQRAMTSTSPIPPTPSSTRDINSFSVPERRSSEQNSMPPPANGNGSVRYSSLSSGQYRSSSSPPDGSNGGPNREASAGKSAIGGGGARNESEWQKVRHKQQRLLLLRHASKCKFEAGKCPVTAHCASMKKLWEHIAHCKDHQCTVQHCMSSRYVLSHYRRCKDPRCLSCGPVRDTIRKSHEREKLRQSQGMAADPTSLDPEQQMLVMITSEMSASEQQSLAFHPMPKRAKTEHRPAVSSSSGAALFSRQPGARSEQTGAKKESQGSVSESAGGTPDSGSKPDDHSLINSFTVDQIRTHIVSLNRAVVLNPAKLKSKCNEILRGLQNHQHGWVFNTPVDPVELGLPDYFDIIKKPMDLGTVNRKLDNGIYHTIENFIRDVQLTFDNAMLYNEESSVVHDMAKELKSKVAHDYQKVLTQLEAEDRARRQNERACTLCGCEKLLYEPPAFFCNGMNCQSKRIRRNSHFYIAGNNQYFWCTQCFNELDSSIPIELMDMAIMKGELKKKKNDEVHEESWVECDGCKSWVHQICGLFNSRQNKEHHTKYFCPSCLLRYRERGVPSSPRPPSAVDLPRTRLSETLEKHVMARVTERKMQLVQEKAAAEGTTLEKAREALDLGGPIIVRQVTATERKLEVRELMKKRYAHKSYPDEFPYRCKCIVVFQNIHGVDAVLFALYVYEHGEDSPPPNQRCVYISYLDSVHFMRPRKLRTFVYHEILIKYLDYVRSKGFATAHIWACPPLKGDDYIFYAKPEDQKTPRDARLRQWYVDMLIECQRRNIVGKVTNMYDLYFADENLDATAVPYLEGDYFTGEAENVIKEIEDGSSKKAASAGKKKKQSKANKSRKGTRATGIDEEALLASGILDEKKLFEISARDQVMVKLGETIHPMKESFLVAFLNWSGARPEDMVVPDAVVKYREENPSALAPLMPKLEEDPPTNDLSEHANKKRDADGNTRDEEVPKKEESGEPSVKVIDDDAEDMDCEFFNNRQAFLNLCRGNHYQFDELRRAKHTSMMVLWHLHNRDAPKFVQQCASCLKEILSGVRYHCDTCPEYDICEACYRSPQCNRGACTHRLQRISVDNSQNIKDSERGQTEEQRRERQRNLELHIQLIEHAARCKSPTCESSNCAKMKSHLMHGKVCKVRASGGCKICKRIWTLLRIHAQKCKAAVCPVPQCMAIRERLRQMAKQQQAMDDRRRQEMNRHYRMNLLSQSR